MCVKSAFYPRAATLVLKDSSVVIENPQVQIQFLGGKSTSKITVTARISKAELETDCQHNGTITSAEVRDVKVHIDGGSFLLKQGIKLLGDSTSLLQSALQRLIIGKKFTLSENLATIPYLCQKSSTPA